MTSDPPSLSGRPVRGSRTGRPIMVLLDLLGRRWTLRVLWELREGAVKFRDLAQRSDDMSQSVLSKRLKELETARLVVGGEDGWRLSESGAELLQLLLPLSRFSTRWAAAIQDRKTAAGKQSGLNPKRSPVPQASKAARRRSAPRGGD
jgi:DNA-binding HxlR family transcriptional regulator